MDAACSNLGVGSEISILKKEGETTLSLKPEISYDEHTLSEEKETQA